MFFTTSLYSIIFSILAKFYFYLEVINIIQFFLLNYGNENDDDERDAIYVEDVKLGMESLDSILEMENANY